MGVRCEIDQIVYKLYGLIDKETNIVESTADKQTDIL